MQNESKQLKLKKTNTLRKEQDYSL